MCMSAAVEQRSYILREYRVLYRSIFYSLVTYLYLPLCVTVFAYVSKQVRLKYTPT